MSDYKTILAGIPGALERVTVSTINRVATKAAKRSISSVAKEKNYPVKVIQRRVYLHKATVSKPRAVLKINARPMPAIRLGNVRVVKASGGRPGGVRAGNHFIAGGFVRHVQWGPQILQRTGQARYPVVVVKYPLSGILSATFSNEVKNTEMASELKKAISVNLDKGFKYGHSQ